MRHPIKAMIYYELVSIRHLYLIILLILPALSLLLINFFFSEALPKEVLYNETDNALLDFSKVEGNFLNYWPKNENNDQLVENYLNTIREHEELQEKLHYIVQQPELTAHAVMSERDYQLLQLYDVLNNKFLSLDLELAKYNVTAEEYAHLEEIFVPSFFSMNISASAIQIEYNISELELINKNVNSSLTLLTFHNYYHNYIGLELESLLLESLSGQQYNIHSFPNVEIAYNEFTKIDRAGFQLATIILFSAVSFFAARDRGVDHKILRMFSLNECAYWLVRSVSTLLFAMMSSIILIFVAWYEEMAHFNEEEFSTLLFATLLFTISSSGGGILLSSIFGSNNVVLPLIITMLIGFIVNFVIEIVISEILGGDSIYDHSLVPSLLPQILGYVDFTFSSFEVLDYCILGEKEENCVKFTNYAEVYQVEGIEKSCLIAVVQWLAYEILALIIAYTKKEDCYPGCIIFSRKKSQEQNAFVINNLSHSYEKTEVLHNLSYNGEFPVKICLIGLSGAGKTTFLKILAGQLRPSKFEGSIFGKDLRNYKDLYELKREIGYCPQDNSNVLMNFTIEQNIIIAGLIKGKINNEHMLGLNNHRQVAKSLSGGQLRRLALLNASEGDNELLILDEITSGLDPLTCKLINEFLQEEENSSLFLSTHDMKEVEDLANYIIVLQNGKFSINQVKQDFLNNSHSIYFKIFCRYEDENEILDGLNEAFPNQLLFKYNSKQYLHVEILEENGALVHEFIDELEELKEQGAIESYEYEENDFSNIIADTISNEVWEFNEDAIIESSVPKSKLRVFNEFFALYETKEFIIPFYITFAVLAILFVIATYILSRFFSSFIDDQLTEFYDKSRKKYASDCLECCGVDVQEVEDYENLTEEELLLLMSNCPVGCYSSTSSSYYNAGSCEEFISSVGGDVPQPRIFNVNEAVEPYYTGEEYDQLYINSNIDFPMVKQEDYIGINGTLNNESLDCALFREKCYSACENVNNNELCHNQCTRLMYGNVSSEYEHIYGYNICQEQTEQELFYEYFDHININETMEQLIDSELKILTNSCVIDALSDEYEDLELKRQFLEFNRSYIVQNNLSYDIYGYLPYYLGTASMYNEFKAECKYNEYTIAKDIAASPFDANFFNTIYTLSNTTEKTFTYVNEDNEWHTTTELVSSLGNNQKAEFLESLSYELNYLFENTFKPSKGDANDYIESNFNLSAEAYPYYPGTFISNSYAMFMDELLFVILTIPMSISGIKYAYDASRFREKHYFELFEYHGVSEEKVHYYMFVYRVAETIPIILCMVMMSYFLKIMQKDNWYYLIVYELILSINATTIGLFTYKLNTNTSNSTFIASVLLLVMNFIGMFSFKNNFLMFLFPYIEALNRLININSCRNYEWLLAAITLISALLEFTLLNYRFEKSRSCPVSELSISMIQKTEALPCDYDAEELNIQDLVVVKQKKEILHSLSINISINESIALLGLSGSGKTTLLNCILKEQAYSGTINLKKTVTFIPEFDILFDNFTLKQTINLFENLHGTKSDELINYLELAEQKANKTKNLSGGEKRRLSFAIAYLQNSDIFACDEACTGLSIDLRRKMWELISTRKQLIITTHDLDEVEALCDYVLLINNGRLLMSEYMKKEGEELGRSCDSIIALKGQDYDKSLYIKQNNIETMNRVLEQKFLEWIE